MSNQTSTSPRYEIRVSKNGEFYWVFIAKNGEEISKSSEFYTSKQNCEKSIMVVKKSHSWLSSPPIVDITI